MIVRLTTGVEIGFAPRDAKGLPGATREDLAVIEVEALGLSIHFPRLDVDFHVAALLEGVWGRRPEWPRGWVPRAAGCAAARRRQRRGRSASVVDDRRRWQAAGERAQHRPARRKIAVSDFSCCACRCGPLDVVRQPLGGMTAINRTGFRFEEGLRSLCYRQHQGDRGRRGRGRAVAAP